MNIHSNIECCYLQSYMSCSTCNWCTCTLVAVHPITVCKWYTHTLICAIFYWISSRVDLWGYTFNHLLEDSTNQLQEVHWSTHPENDLYPHTSWERGYLIYPTDAVHKPKLCKLSAETIDLSIKAQWNTIYVTSHLGCLGMPARANSPLLHRLHSDSYCFMYRRNTELPGRWPRVPASAFSTVVVWTFELCPTLTLDRCRTDCRWRVGLDRLCWHNFEHNRCSWASRIMLA